MKDIIDYKLIGKNIKKIRKKKKITQEQLANIINIAPSYVSAIETGTSKTSLSTFIMIANALGTTVDCLLGEIQPAFMEKYDLDAKELLSDCTEEERALLLRLLSYSKEEIRKTYHSNK